MTGVGYLGRGLAWMGKRPKQYFFGLIPAIISLARSKIREAAENIRGSI